METMKDLKAQLASVQSKISKIEREERRTEMMALIGKCFRYRNCYSCPQKPSDYWWLYSMPVKVRSDGWLEVFEFQADKDGKIIIDAREKVYRSNYYDDGWKEISQSKFNQAWQRIVERVKRSKP